MIVGKEKNLRYVKIGGILLLFALGTLFLALASPLHPWSKQYPDIDSSIFIYFGKAMREGFIPYKDMFDHKGPFLWVIQWLGITLGNGNLAGIWFLEWFCLIFDAWFLYQCARLFTKSDWVAVVAAGLSLEPLIHFLEDGNYGEEWALPFIIYSLYVFLKYLKDGTFKLWQVFLTGVCLGCVLGIRVNMVAVWAAFLPFIFFRLIWLKQWKELRGCCLAFLGGLCAATLPFIIYYAAVGALGDMWYAHITYNFFYTKESGGIMAARDFVRAVLKANWIIAAPFLFHIVYLLVMAARNRKVQWEWIVPAFYILTLAMAAVGGYNFPHYAIILIPCLSVPLCVIMDLLCGLCRKIWIFTAVIAVLCLFTLKADIYKQKDMIEANEVVNEYDEELIGYIEEHSEKNDPILVMALNAKYYITTDRYAGTRYFIQHFMYDDDRSLYGKIMDYIDGTPPKLIIMRVYNVDGDPWGEWMIQFHEDMLRKVDEGKFSYFANEFFVAFERKD